MLAIFECAATNRSFTAAAEELGLTQSGVSRQISALERALGQPLFDRSANRVVLNEAGAVLLAAVTEGFEAVDDGLDRIGSRLDTFLLAVNPGYAQVWIVPYLESLRAALGDIEVRLRFIDRDGELTGGGFDAAIHLTRAAGLPHGSRALFGEVSVPVATPEFAAEFNLDHRASAASLLDVKLLHLDGRERQWMGWETWFAANDLRWSDADARLSYNNHALVMEEALAGRGVALGWVGIVDAAIESGRLVEVGPRVATTDSQHYLVPGPRTPTHLLDAIEEWVQQLSE